VGISEEGSPFGAELQAGGLVAQSFGTAFPDLSCTGLSSVDHRSIAMSWGGCKFPIGLICPYRGTRLWICE
jgi:Ca2+/Na+ antiporter